MIDVIRYKCEYCGMEYATTEECGKCEAGHMKFVSLVSQSFDKSYNVPAKFPGRLIVRLEDNHYAEYSYVKPLLASEMPVEPTESTYDIPDNTGDDNEESSDSNDNTDNNSDDNNDNNNSNNSVAEG